MPTDATLTKIERNAAFELVVAAGLNPIDFLWEDVKSEEFSLNGANYFKASRLVHRTTEYYFTFGGYSVECSPGQRNKVEWETHDGDLRFKFDRFARWLDRVKQEAEAPDLWATVAKERELSDAAASPIENSPFTPAERAKIHPALEELKQYLLAGVTLQVEQAKFVESQFRYLRESSERVGRKDWLLILYATLINIVVSVALPSENVHGLLRLAGTLLHGLWSGMHGVVQ